MANSPDWYPELTEEREDEPVRTSSSWLWSHFLDRRKRSKAAKSLHFKEDAGFSDILKDIIQVKLRQIKKATDNFAGRNRIVYDVIDDDYLHDYFDDYLIDEDFLRNLLIEVEYPIAVRRFATSKWCLNNIKNEISVLTSLKHDNIARLLGYCREDNEFMLIYEYPPNENVNKFLFVQEVDRRVLDWNERCNICLGIAKGLAHLHKEMKVIHHDIKTANIFLSSSSIPKITGFSLAERASGDVIDLRSTRISGDMIDSNTRKIAGTIRYFDPEFVKSGKHTEKLDVYSYGVVILEIVSGKRCFQNYVHQLHETVNKQGDLLQFLDERVALANIAEKASVLLKLSAICTTIPSERRPEMTKVVAVLKGEIDIKELTEERSDVNEDGDVCAMDINPTSLDAKELTIASKSLLKKLQQEGLSTQMNYSHQGETLSLHENEVYKLFEDLELLVQGNDLENAISEEVKPKILSLCKILEIFLPSGNLMNCVDRVNYLVESSSDLYNARTCYCLEVRSYEGIQSIVEQLKRGRDADASIGLRISLLENWLAEELPNKDKAENMLKHYNIELQWKLREWKYMQEKFQVA